MISNQLERDRPRENAKTRPPERAGSRFAEVWRDVTRDPYRELPQRRLRWRDLVRLLPTRLLRAAERTLEDERDLLPEFEKLVHPIGIALRGVWHISEPSPYTGWFAQGREGLLIARASDAVGETREGRLRFMGLAGKLYPTVDADHREPLRTANFFTLENLGGSHSPYFAHASYVTDLLPFVPQPGMVKVSPIGIAAGAAFAAAAKTLDFTEPAIRQLYPIAELGGVPREQARSPKYMRLVGEATNPAFDASDLRVELANAIIPHGLRFRIEVADDSPRWLPRDWHAIGSIVFREAVASHGADHRLHFPHPKYR